MPTFSLSTSLGKRDRPKFSMSPGKCCSTHSSSVGASSSSAKASYCSGSLRRLWRKLWAPSILIWLTASG